MEQRQAHSAFIFDGTESNEVNIWSGTSRTQVIDTSVWDGRRLVITTTERGFGPMRVVRKRSLWLDSNDILVVESSTPPGPGGGPWSSTESRYRRVLTGRLAV
jgi:hypothetical protein